MTSISAPKSKVTRNKILALKNTKDWAYDINLITVGIKIYNYLMPMTFSESCFLFPYLLCTNRSPYFRLLTKIFDTYMPQIHCVKY